MPLWWHQNAHEYVAIKADFSGAASLIASQAHEVSAHETFFELYWTDARNGKKRRQFDDITSPFVFSPDGKYFAATIENPKTYEYQLTVLSVPDGNTVKIMDLASFPAAAYDDGSLRVREIETGELKLDKTSQTVDIAWRGNNKIVTAEANDGVKFWRKDREMLNNL